ncbi:hypothetical protein TEA_004180 [Camellia sinensis var. sinensis]|uniref:Uncharacterized protein n=1 Tax=Camellia sinensis var. sinensis TaxID=542762 RepID=A0A4S4ELM3_CAMSN|nr:hypothetical protein TEA_004180 [Camellia sinensis var. sinensis]
MKSYEDDDDDDDDDFEFLCVCKDLTSTDEIFNNSQIKLVFPIFGKDLLFSDVENCKGEVNSSKPPTPSLIQIPEDRDPPDGKDTFVFLAPLNANSKKKNNKKASERATKVKVTGKVKPTVAGGGVTVAQEGDRRW